MTSKSGDREFDEMIEQIRKAEELTEDEANYRVHDDEEDFGEEQGWEYEADRTIQMLDEIIKKIKKISKLLK